MSPGIIESLLEKCQSICRIWVQFTNHVFPYFLNRFQLSDGVEYFALLRRESKKTFLQSLSKWPLQQQQKSRISLARQSRRKRWAVMDPWCTAAPLHPHNMTPSSSVAYACHIQWRAPGWIFTHSLGELPSGRESDVLFFQSCLRFLGGNWFPLHED